MGAYWKRFGKIATPQISIKLGEDVVITSTKHHIKYFAQTVNCLTSRGQIDVQITWVPTTYGRRLGKIATAQISLKLGETVVTSGRGSARLSL